MALQNRTMLKEEIYKILEGSHNAPPNVKDAIANRLVVGLERGDIRNGAEMKNAINTLLPEYRYGASNAQLGATLAALEANLVPRTDSGEITAMPGEPFDPSKKSQEEILQEEVAKRMQSRMQTGLDDTYANLFGVAGRGINDIFDPQRENAVAEEARLGRLRSPQSIVGLSRIDTDRNRAMADIFGKLQGQKAQDQLGVSRSIEEILQGERNAGRQESQFGRSLDLQRSNAQQQNTLNLMNLQNQWQMGVANREAQEEDGWGRFGQVAGGIGALGGGVGGAFTGIGKGIGYMKGKKTPGGP